MKNTFSKRALFIKILISGAFFWILFSFVQTNELVRLFTRIDWFYFIFSFILIPVMLVVSCLKWKMILDLNSKKIPFSKLIRIYLIGYLFSNLLPSTVGGDVARSYYSGKIIKNQSFSAIAIFIERFSGVFLLFFLVVLSPLLKSGLYLSPYFYIPGIGSFFLILITVWIWYAPNPLEFPDRIARYAFKFINKIASLSGLNILKNAEHVIEKKYRSVFNRFVKLHQELREAVATIGKDKLLFLKISGVTILFYLLTWVNVYIAFKAFGVEPEFLGVCALVPTVLFVAQIPVTLLGNLGFFESVFVVYFLFLGVPGAETLAMGLLLRLKMLTIGGVGYLAYISYSNARYVGEEFEQVDIRID